MKRFFILITCVLLLTAALVSCDGGGSGSGDHTHKYADSWSSDADGHWYAATCEHTSERANYAAHADSDNDGVCDTCKYAGDHTHEYSEEWTHDAEKHWHAASCGHSVKGEEGAHADSDNDGVCDGCDWNYDHTHGFASEWTHDAEKHWHAAACGHSVMGEAGAHADSDNDGVCDGCGWNYDHTHTYESKLTSDATGHWYKATCAHTGVKGEFAAHEDKNNDGDCDTCKWNGGHTHTYNDGKWTSDDTHHWHAPTCGHNVVGKDKDEHVDTDGNNECDVCLYTDCDHTFSPIWSRDAEKHWYASTCGHAVTKDEGKHVDENNDGVCDGCKWNYDHTHTYSETLQFDGTNHFYAVTCGHNVPAKGVESHWDPDNDGACNQCAWTDGCNHTYDTAKWSKSANYHYHKATCGHDVRADITEHNDGNLDGKCDTCGAYDSMETVIDKATSKESMAAVSSGTYKYDMDGAYSYSYKYFFGSDYTCINGPYGKTYYTLFQVGSETKLFAATDNGDGTFYRDNYASANLIDGCEISIVGHAIEAYGIENLLYTVYQYVHDPLNSVYGLTEDYDEASDSYIIKFFAVTPSFGCDTVISFKLDENGAVKTVTVLVDDYGNETDYTVDPDTGAYSINRYADPYTVWNHKVDQTIGERTKDENPYAPEKYLVNDLKVLYGPYGREITEGATLPVKAGVLLTFNFPAADMDKLEYDNITMTSTAAVYSQANYSYNGWNKPYTATFTGVKAGKYEVTIASDLDSVTFYIDVTWADPTTMSPVTYDGDGVSSSASSVTVYEGSVIKLAATVNTNANPNFIPTLSSGDASFVTMAVDPDDPLMYTFKASKPGTYVITMTSAVKPSVKCTLTVTVLEAPDLSGALNGVYSYNETLTGGSVKAEFLPMSGDPFKGTVVITLKKNVGTAINPQYQPFVETMSFEYDAENNVFKLTHLSGEDNGCSFEFTDYALHVVWKPYGPNGMTRSDLLVREGQGSGSEDKTPDIEGSWSGVGKEDVAYSLNITDNFVTISSGNFDSWFYITKLELNPDDGNYYFTIVPDGGYLTDFDAKIADKASYVTADGNTIVIQMADYSLVTFTRG
ncbi:MAG: hypothetical protein IJY04_03160 [Clostridia bacterium]|nr:hypothetical protein [Clostridia bacterium]